MRILLVSPSSPNDLDNRFIREVPYLGADVLFGPTAVVTVAALTPEGHEVVIHDEHLRGPVEATLDSDSFDVVGVNLTTNQFNRALAIADHCKHTGRSAVTVAGGIGAPNLLHHAGHSFDVVIHGEAEENWPRFLADLEEGSFHSSYQRFSRPDLSQSPIPRWDLIGEDIPRYGTLSVQTTRGCPHDCAFCDVIYTYGRRPRSKPVDRITEEVTLLQSLGATMVFVADDNFGGGNRAYAKELLRKLVVLNNSFDQPMMFMTQVDILVSQDPELLELLADANFVDLMIGIESVNEASLRDMNKVQNLRVDPLEAVRTIQSYGIAVLGHMIVGNDSDTPDTFAETEAFVTDAHILHHFCHPLMAPPGTRLWYQYAREGRLIRLTDAMRDRLDVVPNILPRQMSREELLNGLADYWERVNSPEHYLQRALEFVDGVTRQPRVRRPAFRALGSIFRLMGGVIRFYLFRAPAAHRKGFFRIFRAVGQKKPWLMPRAVFLYTCYMMDYKRALHDAELARDQAAWERDHAGDLEKEEAVIPLNESVRTESTAILHELYTHVRPRSGVREELYGIAVEALVEFSDRYGAQLASFDDTQRKNLHQVCDRIIGSSENRLSPDGDLPEDRPPPGFVREVLDSADSTVRVRAGA